MTRNTALKSNVKKKVQSKSSCGLTSKILALNWVKSKLFLADP